ncbi:MAG: DUF29 family protein [Phormidium sp.]
MEELIELKKLLLKGDIKGSLAIVEELEEMSKQDFIDKVRSYAIILLLHLIKQQAEKRTTRSWEVSIRNSVREIKRKNKRCKAVGYYLTLEELNEILEEAFLNAIDEASLEVAEGLYETEELAKLVDKAEIIDRALTLILPKD